MADRPHIVTVVLEGKDKLSGIFGKAAQSFDEDIKKFRKSAQGLRKDNDDLGKSFDQIGGKVGSQGTLFDSASRGAEKLATNVRAARAEVDKLTSSAQKNKASGFLGGVRGGVNAANDERARIASQLATTKEEFNLRKKLIQSTFEDAQLETEKQHGRTLLGIKEENRLRIQGAKTTAEESLKRALENARLEAAQFDENIRKRNAALSEETAKRIEGVNLSNQKLLEGVTTQNAINRKELEERLAKEIAGTRATQQLRLEALDDELAKRRQATLLEIGQLRSDRDKEKDAGIKALFQADIEERERSERKIRDQKIADLEAEITKEEAAQKKAHDNQLALIDAEGKREIDTQKEENREALDGVKAQNDEDDRRAKARNEEDKRSKKEQIEAAAAAASKINDNDIATAKRVGDEAIETEKRRAAAERTSNIRVRRASLESNANPDEAGIVRAARSSTKESEKLTHGLQRMGFVAGRAFGDIKAGFRNAKNGFRSAEGDAKVAAGIFQNFGFAIGKVVKNFGDFVNLKWLAITGFVASFLSLIVQASVAVVALASSLAIAATALGGAFVAALSQAIPVAGLFAAAMNRVKAVLAAVKLSDAANLRSGRDAAAALDARTQAAQRLADAHHTLKNAILGVSDAQFSLTQAGQAITDAQTRQADAIRGLNDARRKAARDIVDANLEETKSAIDLKDAELAVVEAKRKLREEELKKRQSSADVGDAQAAVKEAQQRLAIAKQEGDQAEISSANQSLTLAKQNLDDVSAQADEIRNNVKQAQVDVQQSEQKVKSQRIVASRAKEDAQLARSRGVEGSDTVRTAKQQVKDVEQAVTSARHQQQQAIHAVAEAIHAVAVARREENDASKKLNDPGLGKTQAQETLAQTKAELSKSELGLFNSIVRIKKIFKREFRPVTDIIIQSFTGAVNAIAVILQDPKIKKAAIGLAGAISDGVNKISKFVVSKEFRKDLIFFFDQAKQNFPTVVNIFLNLFKIFTRIARAAAPLFKSLLDGLDGLTGRGEKASGTTGRLSKFFESAGKHLKSWLEFGKAIGRVLFYLGGGAAPTGKSLLDSLNKNLNGIADWLRDNPEKVRKFFEGMGKQISTTAKDLSRLTVLLFKAFSSKNFANLATTFTEVIIPGLVTFLVVLGKVSGGLLAILKIPIVGDIVKLALTIGITERAFNKLFPATQHLTNGLKFLAKNGFKESFSAVGKFVGILGEKGLGKALVSAGRAIFAFGVTIGRAFVAALGPWGIAILAVVAAVILLDRKFHFIRPTIDAVLRAFKAVFNWIKDHWKLVLLLLTGPIGLAILTIRRHFNDIKKAAEFVINWIRDHWRILAVLLGGPFGIAVAVISKHWDTIKNFAVSAFKFIATELKKFGTEFYNLFVAPFVKVELFILSIFKKLPGLIKDALSGIPGILTGIIKSLPGGSRFLKILGGAKDIAGKAAGVAADQTGVTSNDSKKKTAGEGSINSGDILSADEKFHGKAIDRLRASGLTDDEILRRFIKRKVLTVGRVRTLAGGRPIKALMHALGIKGFMAGGEAGGIGTTDTVPAMLTPGEWVLNAKQQENLAQKVGTTVAQLKATLFGTQADKKPHTKPSATEAPFYGKTFNLVPQTDDNNNTVYFLEFNDGTFGQVTKRDADKIVKSKGNYIPGYAKRNSHGFSQSLIAPRHFAMGGVVPRGFASGGIVSRPATMGAGGHKTINQEYNVQTYGDTDWHAVMRLGALHAQESY